MAPTLVVQLEGAQAFFLEGPEVDGDGVGGAPDHLPFHQQCLVGQDGQAGAVHPSDGEQLPLRQVHALHLGESGAGETALSSAGDRAPQEATVIP